MDKSLRLSIVFLIIVMTFLVPLFVFAQDAVQGTVYFSPTCDSCELAKEQILRPLEAEYGQQLQLTYVDVSQPAGLLELEMIEERLGKANNPLPVIVIGDQIIASDNPFEIEDALRVLLDAASTGPEPTMPPTATPEPTAVPPVVSAQAPIYMAYIEKDGCEHCARASVVLEMLQIEYPQLVIVRFNNMHDADQIEAMGQYLGLPSNRRLIAPSLYIGEDALVIEEITSTNVRQLLAKYADQGAPAFWETLDANEGSNSIIQRFRTMGPMAVIVAALIDGINPCAFATIIFFVSYLAISHRKRSALIAVGLAFTAGVFVTYLAVGLGAMSLLRLANTVRIVGLVLYSVMTLGCFVLAGLSIHDYLLARQGRLKDMSLNLPDKLRNSIHGRIRQSRRAFAGTAFVTGMVVSLLELACTGQVYLPTISFVIGIPEMRLNAIGYLVLYNIVFVLPLVAVLMLAVFGISTKRFQTWFEQNAAHTKLIMAVLFVLLGLLLLTQVLSL